MKFQTPLLRGKFLQRYKRFFADIELDSGEIITAHTPNTGTMLSCKDPGAEAYVSTNDNPKRKLKYTWELVASNGQLAGVNTGLANGLATEAIQEGLIPELTGYTNLRREVKYGQNSRVDILLEEEGKPPFYVEVKNVTLGREGVASFPDAVSTRAAKHMRELADQVREGSRAAVLFVVQRMDCQRFTAADDIDPAYGEILREAQQAGVMALAWQANISPTEIRLEKALPIDL